VERREALLPVEQHENRPSPIWESIKAFTPGTSRR
jgi:hypothetical protein